MENFLSEQNFSIWKIVFEHYQDAVVAKAAKLKPEKKKDLITLDKWYQNELSEKIKGRKPRHITQEEICQLMKWKLTRGKFRPRLTEMVQTNTSEQVLEASTTAFQKLPSVQAAIQALTVLKAVGPATASAVLAAGAPEHVAFMADECMHALPGLQPIKYDLPFYLEYLKQIQEIVKNLNTQDPEKSWTAHKVELTLWTYQIIKTLDSKLYDKLNKAAEKSYTSSDGPPKKKAKTA